MTEAGPGGGLLQNLLRDLRVHARYLAAGQQRETAAEEDPTSEWQEGDWLRAFQLLFLGEEARPESGGGGDDLLFFVPPAGGGGEGQQGEEEGGRWRKDSPQVDGERTSDPFFVRRWAPVLPVDLCPLSFSFEGAGSPAPVDWYRSCFLNTIVHANYTLTVYVCSQDGLRASKEGGPQVQPIAKVSQRVFASPSRLKVETKTGKAQELVPAYPTIHFNVHDFDDVFHNLVVSEPDQCLCVLLKASLQPRLEPPSGSQALIFSGFLGHEQICAAHAKSKGGGVLRAIGLSRDVALGRPDMRRVVLTGPGGQGEAEIAVSSGIRGQSVGQGPAEAEATGTYIQGGSGGGWGLRGALNLVSQTAGAAKGVVTNAAKGLSARNGADVELRCCLMSINLTWQSIGSKLFAGKT